MDFRRATRIYCDLLKVGGPAVEAREGGAREAAIHPLSAAPDARQRERSPGTLRILRPLALAVLFGILAAGRVSAGTEARVYGEVLDESEQPVGGMTITVTDPQAATFRMVAETETDDEGKYSLVLSDATREYVYRLEKDGYETFETRFKVPAGSRKEMNFTVLSVLAPELFNEGNAAARAGDLALAEAKYREALARDQGLTAARAALAAVLLMEKQYAEGCQTKWYESPG